MEKRCISDSFTFKCRFFFGRLERISRTVYLGETEEQELVRKNGDRKKSRRKRLLRRSLRQKPRKQKKQTEVKKRDRPIRVLIRSDDFAELSHEELRILCKEKGLLLEKGKKSRWKKRRNFSFRQKLP